MKPALRIASYVTVLAVGLVGGYYTGVMTKEGQSMAFDMIETDYYSAYMNAQMSEGTDAGREEAIRTFLALGEQRKQRRTMTFPESAFAFDAALGYARLALLAERRGSSREAKEYSARSASYCPQLGWSDCSAQKIADTVVALDKQGLFSAPGSK